LPLYNAFENVEIMTRDKNEKAPYMLQNTERELQYLNVQLVKQKVVVGGVTVLFSCKAPATAS
jgi:hypothetical protein